MWIDCEYAEVGYIGYLVEVLDTNTGRSCHTLHEQPARTNRSHEPRLSGWCGETNNRSLTACGVWRVVQLNRTGERARIVGLTGDELSAFLEQDGYPELLAS
jgi:hypothetical protein